MQKLITLFTVILLQTSPLFSQHHYIIYFKDKGPEKNINLQNPGHFLSQKAIDRRAKSNIKLTDDDLPVSKTYLKTLSKNNCRILESSKWLNAVIIETNYTAPQLQSQFTNISKIGSWKLPDKNKAFLQKRNENSGNGISNEKSLLKTNSDYGQAKAQNNLIGIEYLHDKGFRGDNITIAVFDIGFSRVNTIDFFDSLNNENRIISTRNFWNDTADVYYIDDHGTMVLSILAANTPGEFVGTAPKADYALAITDDYYTETPQDELYMVKAMEWADSLGADIISASVSYNEFDSGHVNYIYSDMDGKTSISAKGTNIAVSKGIIFSNSIGNMSRICTPCDAMNILCVGGADDKKAYDKLSATGPSSDKRIKPDVAALTVNTSFVLADGTIWQKAFAGTSAATPQITGLAACLLQAHPKRTNIEIVNSIIQSANNYSSPDTLTGYGVPNARIADSILHQLDLITGIKDENNLTRQTTFKIFPNPAKNTFSILASDESHIIPVIKLYSSVGSLVNIRKNFNSKTETIDITDLHSGIYFLQIINGQKVQQLIKLIKD